MRETSNARLTRLLELAIGSLTPPVGKRRIIVAISYGIICHFIFLLAVISMMTAMFFGMSQSLGGVPPPWNIAANLALILQFPLAHSILLTKSGQIILSKLAPSGYGATLATTTFAIIASVQLLALFAFWTPSGTIWWQAQGWPLAIISTLYALSWLLLIWASFDAGAEVQSGALGWMSLVQKIKPVFPDMPTQGLFKIIRQPIYVAFALTTWTVPIWTPDQLCLAIVLSAYCLLAPRLKERRFSLRYGARFADYRAKTPYAFPKLSVFWKGRSSR